MAEGKLPRTWTGLTSPQTPEQPASQAFSQGANDVRVFRVPLDAAQNRRQLHITGNVIWAIRASSASANMLVSINKAQGDGIPVTQGLAMRTPPFTDLWIENTAQAGEWIDLVYFVAWFDFFVVNPGSTVSTVTLSKPNNGLNHRWTITPVGTLVQLDFARANRRAVILQADPANPSVIHIGWNATTNLSDTVGIRLYPGDSMTFEGTLRFDGWIPSTGTAPCYVNAMEILD